MQNKAKNNRLKSILVPYVFFTAAIESKSRPLLLKFIAGVQAYMKCVGVKP